MLEFKRLKYSRTDSAFFSKKAFRISGLKYFRIDNTRTVVNNLFYYTRDLTIGILKKIVEKQGGLFYVYDQTLEDISLLECQNYCNRVFLNIDSSPVDLNYELFRLEDVSYTFTSLDSNTEIVNGFILSNHNTLNVEKDVDIFDIYILDIKHRGFYI